MNIEKLGKIMDWVSKNIDNVPIGDQFKIVVAVGKFAEEVEPIYDKYTAPKESPYIPASLEELLQTMIIKKREDDEE